MQIAFRSLACALLCAFSAAAHSQQATSWVSAEWTPMTEENARALQAADSAFKTAVEADWQARVKQAKASHVSRGGEGGEGGVSASDQGKPLPGGMKGPGEPRGHGSAPPPPAATSLEQLLPAALDFAAPTSGGLIVQRMSSSVMFGRTDNAEVVMLPLSGEADLPHGMRGSIREEGAQLRLVVQLATGQVVEYHYLRDAANPDRVMSVAISVLGALPGASVNFTRSYRRAQVNVGELKKAGQ
jgi:hypothetical protein